MADGNQLAQAYSILGQATTAEYKRRRKEEEEYEKRMMRNQILGYLAQPLLKTAGEAIGKGVTGFASDVILGENARSYFDREEGIVTARKARLASKVEKDISEQLGQLSTGGKTSKDGAFNLFNTELEKMYLDQYGTDDKTKQVIKSLLAANKDSIREASDKWHDGLESLGIYAGKAPTPEELAARLKNDDHVFGMTKGQRAAKKLFSGLTPGTYKDRERESVRYLVTGSKDPSNVPSWYLDFQDAGFEEELTKKFESLQDLRPETLDNMLTEFVSSNPEMKAYFDSLEDVNQRQIMQAPSQRMRQVELETLRTSEETSPLLRTYLNSTEGKKHVNKEDALRGFVSSIGGVQDLETFATRYQVDVGTEETNKLIEAVSVSTFGKDFEKLKRSEQETARSQTKQTIKVFAQNFNRDLADALSQLDGEQLQSLTNNLTPGARRVLANQYISFQINNNLRPEIEEVDPYFFGSPYMEETGRLTSSLKDPEAGLNFILSKVSDSAYVDSAATEAVKSGIAAQVKKENRRMVDPYFVSLNTAELSKQFSFVNDPLISKEEREKGVMDGLRQLEEAINEKAISEGYRMSDNSANISPVLVDQLEEFRKSLMARIYPLSPTGMTTPVGLGI